MGNEMEMTHEAGLQIEGTGQAGAHLPKIWSLPLSLWGPCAEVESVRALPRGSGQAGLGTPALCSVLQSNGYVTVTSRSLASALPPG